MNQHARYLTKPTFLATCLAFAFSSAGSLGCGDEAGGVTVDSQLLGVYQIDQYQVSPEGCDSPADASPPSTHVALYSYLKPDKPDDPLFLGKFCGGVQGCRNAVRDFPEFLNPGYSFSQGNDTAGWFGWGIPSSSRALDQCQANVQAHKLTSDVAQTIRIETRSFDVVYPPAAMEGNTIDCTLEDALRALSDEPPCLRLDTLEATFKDVI